MKRSFVIPALLLGACSTVQPVDAFADLCRPQSNRSCPSDTDTPILLTGTAGSNPFAAANAR